MRIKLKAGWGEKMNAWRDAATAVVDASRFLLEETEEDAGSGIVVVNKVAWERLSKAMDAYERIVRSNQGLAEKRGPC